MKKDYNLNFLRTKIEETKAALCTMYNTGFSYIIQTKSVDDNGCISFNLIDSLPKNTYNLESFRIKLFYYKKSLGYYLNIDALANVLNAAKYIEGNEPLKICAKILSAEYSDDYKQNDTGGHGILYSIKQKVRQIAAGLF